VMVKKRSETIEQAAPISVDKATGSTDGPVKKKPDMDKQRDIQAIKAGLPNKTCLHRRPGHASLDVTPELLQPDYNVTMEYRKYQRKYPQKKVDFEGDKCIATQLDGGVQWMRTHDLELLLESPGLNFSEVCYYTLPLVSDTVAVLGSREPVPIQQEEAVPVQQDVQQQAHVRVTRSKRLDIMYQFLDGICL
ncbi:hypothetical protein IFM89_019784, partial [Coptis chinensis]